MGSATFRRGISPVLPPPSKQHHVGSYQASPGLPAQHIRLEAKQSSNRLPRPQASFPQVGCFSWVIVEGAGNPSAAEEFRFGRRGCQKYHSSPIKTGHPLMPFYQTVNGKRKTFFFLLKNKKTPLQLKKKCFHLLILNFYLKQILSFKTKCCF